MRRRSRRIAALVVAGLTAAGLAACSNSSGGSSAAGSKPVHGGTLKFVAASGPDHIDTVPA
jgi:ABC-type glycerol-3-phosphate transport system substrate-binding protein